MAAKKLFYSMGEVSEMFDVNPSLIRHWESKFDCLRPHKNKKGNRMFSPEDVEKLKQIYNLVKEQGMTLEGANKVMRSSRRELSRETELLERLQRIRSALVEVREELKSDDEQSIIVSAGVDLRDDADNNYAQAEMSESRKADEQKEVVESRKVVKRSKRNKPVDNGEAVEESMPIDEDAVSKQAEAVFAPTETVEATAEATAEAEVTTDATDAGNVSEAVASGDAATPAEVSQKRPRRKKKKEEAENKELFPFYEQSLF